MFPDNSLCASEGPVLKVYGCARQVLMARRLSAVVVLALARLPMAVVGLASCCVNSTSGIDFADDCTCLADNTQLPGQFLAAGQTRIYHWVLSMDNSELVSGSVRGNLTFEVCTHCCMFVRLLSACGATSR